MSALSPKQMQTFLDIATVAATTAGGILKTYLGNVTSVVAKGEAGDLVTEADKAAETIILEVLNRHFPSHAILAEESGTLGQSSSEYLWAIDPLDGTTNFAHGYPFSAVSIGLLIAGIPRVGVIYNPFADELFQAATGWGAKLNQREIRVSQTATLQASLLVTGFAYDRRQTPDNNYAEFCHLTHLTHGVRRSGSAALDLASVACGRLDGYWERGIKPWDMAAGIVLIREAGGKVTAYDESLLEIESGRVLATNGYLHSALSQALLQIPTGVKESFKSEYFY
jgi:myo-inositol-1(or 4)-monophosphatase